MCKIRQLEEIDSGNVGELAEKSKYVANYGLACYSLLVKAFKATSFGAYDGDTLVGYVLGVERTTDILIFQVVAPSKEIAYEELDELIKKSRTMGKGCAVQLNDSDRGQFEFYTRFCESRNLKFERINSSDGELSVIGSSEYAITY